MDIAKINREDLSNTEQVQFGEFIRRQQESFHFACTTPGTSFPNPSMFSDSNYGLFETLRLESLDVTLWAFQGEGARDQFTADYGAENKSVDASESEPADPTLAAPAPPIGSEEEGSPVEIDEAAAEGATDEAAAEGATDEAAAEETQAPPIDEPAATTSTRSRSK